MRQFAVISSLDLLRRRLLGTALSGRWRGSSSPSGRPPRCSSSSRRCPATRWPGVRWTTEQQWHVTLRFLGACDERVAVAGLDGVDAPPCTAVLGPGRGASAATCWWCRWPAWTSWRRRWRRPRTGSAPAGRLPYRGHLTLARAGKGALPRLEAPVAASWVVDRVALVESQLHPAGARYTTVHERMLG